MTRPELGTHTDVLVHFVARVLFGPGLLVAAAMITKAYTEVGDGFAAGVIVSLLVSLHYLALGAKRAEESLPVLRFAPAVAVTGLLLAIVSGFFPLLLGDPVFSHRPGPGQEVTKVGTLELFTPLLFDLSVFLLVSGTLVVLLHQFGRLESGFAFDHEASQPTAGKRSQSAERPDGPS